MWRSSGGRHFRTGEATAICRLGKMRQGKQQIFVCCQLSRWGVNSARRNARFWVSGGIRFFKMLAFRSAGEFGFPKCLLLGQRRNSACRTARFWVSGRIRFAEMLAFRSADEFGLPNCSLLGQRGNSTCRTARF